MFPSLRDIELNPEVFEKGNLLPSFKTLAGNFSSCLWCARAFVVHQCCGGGSNGLTHRVRSTVLPTRLLRRFSDQPEYLHVLLHPRPNYGLTLC